MRKRLNLGPAAIFARVRRSDFLRHGALVFCSAMLVNGANYVFHFLISRNLPVADYGALSSIIAGLTIISVPAMIMTMIVVKYAAEFHALADGARLRTLSQRFILWTSVPGILAGAIVAIASPAIARYLNIADWRPIALAGIILGVNIVLPGARGILQGVQDFWGFAISTGVEAFGKALLGIGFVYAGYGLRGALAGFALATVLGLAYTLVAVRSHYGPPGARLLLDARRLVQTTGGVASAVTALVVLGSIDVLIVKHFVDPHTAGIYGAISLLGKLVFYIVGFIPTVVLPKAAALGTRGESPLPVLARGFALLAAGMLCVLAVLYVAPAFVIRWLVGSAYVAAAPYAFAYGCAMALLAATSLVATYKMSLHRYDFVVPLLAVMAGEVIALNLAHSSLWQVVDVLLIGNSAALLSSLYRITAPVSVAAAGVRNVA